jgi:uncharacterized protein (DUF58 family)
MAERKLNLDIAGAVSELEMLIQKVLPRNIIYRLLLGKGLEFDGFRNFTQQDDASNIDWKASVKAKELLVRKYIEERDLKFVFIVDVSDNMVFGSTEKLKCEYCAELSAALSHLMLVSGDQVGFVLFSDKIVEIRPPELGTKQFEIFVNHLSDPLVYGGKSNLNDVLDILVKTLGKDTSMVFLISDFVKFGENQQRNLEVLSGLFETVAIIVRDPLDNSLPDINKEVIIQNPDTGEKLLINPRVAKRVYEANALNQLSLVKKTFKDFNIDFLELSTDKPFSVGFATFLKERIKGGRIVRLKNVR